MGSENVCIKHEYSYNRDKQLQRKLLAADDTFSTESCAQSSNSVKGLYPPPDKKLCEVTGWCSGEKILLRKHESIAGGKPKASSSVTVVGRSDGRSRREQVDLPMPYVFRHYSDNRKYIEQYRQEHACSDTINSPEIRNEYLCLQHRFYVYNKSKPRYNNSQEIKSAPLSSENSLTQNQIDQEGVKTYSNSACKLKTSTIITLQDINEMAQDKPDNAENELQNAIYNGNRLPLQQPFSRSAPVKQIGNKIIPANHSMISPGFSKSLRMSRKTSQSPKGNSWERNSSAVRNIDSLVCVTNTGDRQLEKRPSPKKPELESSSAGCQSAEATINSRPRFESVGYALPSNAVLLNASRLLTDSQLLNQAEYRCPAFDAGSVFRPSAKSSLLTTPDKESMAKEIIHDLSPQRAEDISMQQKGVSGNLTEPELPSSSELQSALNQGQSCLSIHPQEAKIQKTESKQINDRGLAKHTRSMETSSGSSRTLRFRLATSNGSLEGNGVNTTAQTAITQTTTSIPYLTSWNGSQPRRLKGDNHRRSGSSGSEVNLRQLAEYILSADDLLPQGKFRDLQEHPENHTARKRPSIASGVYRAAETDVPMWFDSNGRAYVSLATRYAPVKK